MTDTPLTAKERKALEDQTETTVSEGLKAAGIAILEAERDGAWPDGLPKAMGRALGIALIFGAALPPEEVEAPVPPEA